MIREPREKPKEPMELLLTEEEDDEEQQKE